MCACEGTIQRVYLIRNRNFLDHSLRLTVLMHAYFNERKLPTSVICVLKIYSIFSFFLFIFSTLASGRDFAKKMAEGKKVMTVSYDNSICTDKRGEWVPNDDNLM